MESGPEAAPAARELYRSTNLVVREVAAGSRDRWVVTFDNYGIGHGFERWGFGEAWLRAQRISAIHIMGRAEDWYQYEDIGEALATARSALEGASRVITYGSSMGGYAAIRFADAVGANAAVALSPQYSLDPRIAGHDKRWSQDVDRIHWRPDLNGSLECQAEVVIAFDPIGLDGWHGRRIVDETRAIPIKLPHTAHPVTSFLSEIGLLGELVLQTLNGDIDARALRREARARRVASGVYLGELALRLPARRLSQAVELARRAVAVNPAAMHSRVSLARLLGRAGLHEEALEHLEILTTTSNRSVVYLVEQGQGLALAGLRTESRAIVDEVLTLHDSAAHLYAWAAHISWLNHDIHDARQFVASAIKLDPGNPSYREASETYERKASLWQRLRDCGQRSRTYRKAVLLSLAASKLGLSGPSIQRT